MKTYTENLYENIFERVANNFDTLRVISGYGSSKFLKRVIEDYPKLSVQLFLGMTAEGVALENHNEYLSMCRQNDKVEVFYQIGGTMNHMKILQFEKGAEKKVFVGSANFTDNGFFHQREIMTEVEQTLDFLLEEQRTKSLACTEQNIANFINFYIGVTKSSNQPKDIEHVTIDDLDQAQKELLSTTSTKIVKDKDSISYNKLIMLRKSIDPKYYQKFELPIVLPSTKNYRWESSGVNAWVDGKTPVLEQHPKVPFKKVFPEYMEFKIYTDDNLVFEAQLTGKFNRQLELLNINLHEYICNRVHLDVKKPISYEELISKNQAILYFERLNFSEFYMSFSEI